jgi:hypothetical protein
VRPAPMRIGKVSKPAVVVVRVFNSAFIMIFLVFG